MRPHALVLPMRSMATKTVALGLHLARLAGPVTAPSGTRDADEMHITLWSDIRSPLTSVPGGGPVLRWCLCFPPNALKDLTLASSETIPLGKLLIWILSLQQLSCSSMMLQSATTRTSKDAPSGVALTTLSLAMKRFDCNLLSTPCLLQVQALHQRFHCHFGHIFCMPQESSRAWLMKWVLLEMSALVTGNTGAVTFWEVQHAAAPTKCCAYHAMPSGRHSTQTVTVPPIFGQNPGDSKTDVCYLPLTHAMTNFPLSCLRLKKSWHSPPPLQQTHCGRTRLAAHHRSSLLFSQKTKRMFSTMISRRKSSKVPARSMMEVTNILKGISGRATLASVSKLLALDVKNRSF
jgi:hypothetical protein